MNKSGKGLLRTRTRSARYKCDVNCAVGYFCNDVVGRNDTCSFINKIISVKDNADQSKNARDLGIAYVLVFLTYTILGLIFYLSYPGYKGCITDMFIEVSKYLFIIYILEHILILIWNNQMNPYNWSKSALKLLT